MNDLTNIIDRIGELKAIVAEHTSELRALEKIVKAHGSGEYHGVLFDATVADIERRVTDWHAVAERLQPSRQLVQAHTKVSRYQRLGVTARKDRRKVA